MILHIPHSSTSIPDELKEPIVLSDEQLSNEVRLMTDWFTDELYRHPDASVVQFPLSRLLVDVERFSDDSQEPMSRKGMGMIYQSTAHGEPLKRALTDHERKSLEEYYNQHHESLRAAVEKELQQYGQALIIDCHSFPDKPLPCNADQSVPRPEICIGTDAYHTPSTLSELARKKCIELGFTCSINSPFAGSLVPMTYYQTEPRVVSIMVEINRKLYMDEHTGKKGAAFMAVKEGIQNMLYAFSDWQKGTTA